MVAALVLIGATGISIGSFVNSCAFRIPRNISVVTTRSFCPACNSTLHWYELVPILSFILLGGRCLRCDTKIPVSYVFIELLATALALSLFIQYSLSWQFAFLLIASNLFLLIALIDWRHLIIPNCLIPAGMAIGLLFNIVNEMSGLLISICSAVASCLLMMLLKIAGDTLFKKQSMGTGDVKLAGVVGLFVGFTGFLAGLWIAAIMGALCGGAMKILDRRDALAARGSALIPGSVAGSVSNLIPFGSFLSVVTILFLVLDIDAQTLIDTWLTLMQ